VTLPADDPPDDEAGREREPSSFRDPSGYLFWRGGELYRFVHPSYADNYRALVESGLSAELADAGLLVRHEEVEPRLVGAPGAFRVLRPELIPFVSYPYEWSFGQLRDAALLTLEIQRRALRRGLWLKDASAYNVQFRGSRPIFIDSLSFEVYPEGRPWVAYQQFCRHFLAPLALMSYRDADLGRLSRLHVDGVPLELAVRLLPARTALRPSLLLHLHAHARFIRRHGADAGEAGGRGRGALGKAGLEGLIASLEGAVRGLAYHPGETEWGDYYAATNYSEAAHAHKQELVAAFVDRVKPATVWDLGANTGLFSRIAARKGCITVAFDLDPAAVEQNYRACAREPELPLTPLVMDLRNPSADLGWGGRERRSLAARGPADLVLALALLHHLAIGNNVPLDQVAEYLARLGRHVVLEFAAKTDSQVRRLLATREDVFPDYSREGVERAFGKSFRVLEDVAVGESERRLYLLAAR
jgi:ribosomal protein L11 methylase PrmA